MLIFRIENEEGQGPWTGCLPTLHTGPWAERHLATWSECRKLYRDGVIDEKKFNSINRWMDRHHSNWFCCFANKKQLRSIVYPRELRYALVNNPDFYLGVYRVHGRYVRQLQQQSVFLRDKATLIRKIRFSR